MASLPNPLYDPDWAATHRARTAACEKWLIICGQIAEQDGFGAPRHRAALAQHQQAKAAAAEALLGQHRTIADYAAWRFGTLPPAKDGVAILPDFDGFQSIADADAAFERAYDRRTETALIDSISLPVRQPAGLGAFAVAENVISSWRRFEPAELDPYPSAKASQPLDCMVSFQQIGEAFHICIAHRWGDLAPQSRDQFRNIATMLARQAITFLHPEAAVIFAGGKHAAPEHRTLIRTVNETARRFYFYRHLWPRRDLKEQFCRVEMAWDGARFIDPDFSAVLYESLPAALRAASEQLP
jgi:hypothetical protein